MRTVNAQVNLGMRAYILLVGSTGTRHYYGPIRKIVTRLCNCVGCSVHLLFAYTLTRIFT